MLVTLHFLCTHRMTLRFPGLPILLDGVDPLDGEERQARKVVAKEIRNAKVSNFRREVVELEEGLHILLQDNATKLFNIEALGVRVCEGGRSAYIKERNKGGKVKSFLRNRRFMNYDPKFRVDSEATMATGEVELGSKGCLPLRQLSRMAGSAFRRIKSSVSSIFKGSLALLTRAPRPAAGTPSRKAVTWA